jgi:hypothetical protein
VPQLLEKPPQNDGSLCSIRFEPENAITDENIYNMDEKGFMMGAIQRSCVLIPIEQKRAYVQQDRNRE